MKILTLGSCRQHPISKHFNVSYTQECLTYPHNSNEILQALKYCSGKLTMTDDETVRCFRTGILHKIKIDQQKFIPEFLSADVFVIEIATRLVYEYKEKVVHHILAEKSYGFNDIPNITLRSIEDAEMKNDIIEIQKLVYPKPLIIATHIYTRKTGKRYDLVRSIKRIANELSIKFIDISEALNTYSPDRIYQKENILAHFTKEGSELAGEEYKKLILY